MRGLPVSSAVLIAFLVGAVGCDAVDENDPLSVESQSQFIGICGNGLLEEAEQCDDGNVAPDDGCSAACALEDARLVITEIMTDPDPVQDRFGEWFELHNPTANPIDLRGWTLRDGKGRTKRVDQSVVVAAGGFASLGRYNIAGNPVFDYAYGNSLVLANQASSLRIFEPLGGLVDEITWDGGQQWPNPRGVGKALQLGAEINAGAANNNIGSSWCYATTLMENGMRGTPGAPNVNCAAEISCGDEVVNVGEQCDDGNANSGDGCSATCQLESILVITEVMQDPNAVSDAAGEWFEVHNPTPYAANLQGWRFSDNGGSNFMVNSSLPVPAGGYVTLGRNANMATNGGIAINYAYGSAMALANQADQIIMRDGSGAEIDRIEWDNGNQWPNPRGVGQAVQFDVFLNPLTTNNNVGANWCYATVQLPSGDFGTPGAANSPCQAPVCGDGVLGFEEECDDGNLTLGDGCDAECNLAPRLVINELMQDPASVSDAAGEWFELLNPTPYDVDIEGWTFRDNGGQNFTIQGPLVVAANGFLVIGKSTNQGLNGGVPVGYAFGSAMALANQADQLIMRDAEGVEIDRVEWDNGGFWPNPASNGRSSQLDPAQNPLTADNNDGTLWCRPTTVMASGDQGTPGAANDPCPVCGDGLVAVGEACDDGNDIAGDGCENDCTLSPVCGDGTVDPGEDCDDGNDIAGDGCEADCTFSPICGDGDLGLGEECDDGNLINGDGCEDDCTVTSTCGDGVVDDGEACDDGNQLPGDGCSELCAIERTLVITEVMQDPVVVSDAAGEWFEVHNPTAIEIDMAGWSFTDENVQGFTVVGELLIAPGGYLVFGRNGNPATNGGIPVDYSYGGAMSHANATDKIVLLDELGAEIDRVEWDNGALWPNPQGRGRSMQFDAALSAQFDDNNVGANWCRPVTPIGNGEFGTPGAMNDRCDAVGGDCGNGVIDEGEQCDDGNVIAGDGCDGTCQIESVCGDGVAEGNEECDDGNLVNNDGCDRLCTDEQFNVVSAEFSRTSTIAAGSSDWFAFTVDSDSFVNIESYGAGGGCSGNTLFNLYTADDLNTPIATDDDGGVSECSLLQMGVSAGDYVLQVTGSGGVQVSTYVIDFTLLVAVTPPGGAFPASVPEGGSDLYAFASFVEDGFVVTVDDGAGGCPPGFDSTVQLFELAGAERILVAENDDGALNAPCSELVVAALPAGNYYLFVGGHNGAALSPHVVTISFGDPPVCGDGVQQVGEACDDGNLAEGDGCDAECQIEPLCGDGTVDFGEECDDANTENGDGCSEFCELESDCGDGLVEGVEQCDDGGVVNGDGCSDICRVEAIIMVTEIMTNPASVDDLQGEWFEVHNPTINDVDLEGWLFTDEVNDVFTVDFSVVVPAGGYALLARLYDPESNGDLPTDFAYGLDMVLANQRTDRIVVRNPIGEEIDRVEWTNATWPSPGTSGVSFQFDPALDPLVDDNNDGNNWCRPTSVMSNGDLGTPGAANDACVVAP